jgi:hypothetical protein
MLRSFSFVNQTELMDTLHVNHLVGTCWYVPYMHVAEFFLIRKSETEYYKKRLLTLGKSRRKRDQGHIRAGKSLHGKRPRLVGLAEGTKSLFLINGHASCHSFSVLVAEFFFIRKSETD